jgi:hypothetical protein
LFRVLEASLVLLKGKGVGKELVLQLLQLGDLAVSLLGVFVEVNVSPGASTRLAGPRRQEVLILFLSIHLFFQLLLSPILLRVEEAIIHFLVSSYL